jgi:hypothetical protein
MLHDMMYHFCDFLILKTVLVCIVYNMQLDNYYISLNAFLVLNFPVMQVKKVGTVLPDVFIILGQSSLDLAKVEQYLIR